MNEMRGQEQEGKEREVKGGEAIAEKTRAVKWWDRGAIKVESQYAGRPS
ncbi:hypothetical protein [Paenibacillus sp. GCM10012303]|jgi:hypothetical protein